MKNKKYNTVGTVLKSGTVPKSGNNSKIRKQF
jgi:hypothetical protein